MYLIGVRSSRHAPRANDNPAHETILELIQEAPKIFSGQSTSRNLMK